MQCPTCRTPRNEDNQWQTGTYRLDGKEHECDCSNQVELLQQYLNAAIPPAYMRLDWKRDFVGDRNAAEGVETYLKMWTRFRELGIGIEFCGASLGIGKTFAAVTIAKELVKRSEYVLFTTFGQVLYEMRMNRAEDLWAKMKNIKVLVVDEIREPPHENLSSIFADRFEEVMRSRTDSNLVTIMTTNMTEDEIEESYPRVYSLLRAKQLQVDLTGADHRMVRARNRNLELAMNNEITPIS